MPATAWRTRSLSAHKLIIDLVDGIEPVVSESSLVQRRDDGVDMVHVGADETLAGWRAGFGERPLAFGPDTPLTVCGRPGLRQEVTVPAETAIGIVASPQGGVGGHLHHETPAQTHVAVAGTTTAGVPFIATWTISVARRDARRADEDHYFGSIRCE